MSKKPPLYEFVIVLLIDGEPHNWMVGASSQRNAEKKALRRARECYHYSMVELQQGGAQLKGSQGAMFDAT